LNQLSADALRKELGQVMIGREIVVVAETTSTNDLLLKMTSPTTPAGQVVFAEHQTAGRGQRGNRWESAPYKGLWFSILLRPKIEIDQSARLTAWASQTVAATIKSQFSIAAKIKAPNDVLIDGKKVAGVLVEMRAQKNAPHFAIAGIGINVNHSAKDFPEELRTRATSLAMALHRQIDRHEFAVTLLRNLDRTYGDIRAL
jgi:BirA family biotin operon repressor/biotin-[acetyl-CoA-carboxylase] ligase